MMRAIVGILICLLLIAGGWFWYNRSNLPEAGVVEQALVEKLAGVQKQMPDNSPYMYNFLQALDRQYEMKVNRVYEKDGAILANVTVKSKDIKSKLEDFLHTASEEPLPQAQLYEQLIQIVGQASEQSSDFDLVIVADKRSVEDIELTDTFVDFLYGGLYSFFREQMSQMKLW